MSLSCFPWCKSTADKSVKEIDLSNSALHDVPPSIFLHERTLDTLHLNSNRIHDLPLPLFHCENLQYLNLSDNDIASIPAAIGSLVHLRTLDLNRNCVEELNEAMKGCKKLSGLNLSMNPVKQFPETVTQLISLEELYLNDTGLDYLPANVGRLVRLRILELRDNKLTSLPKAIARFSNLQRLDIGQNDFTYLPEVVGELDELLELWLDLNGMVELPSFVGNLKKLTHLDVSENCLHTIPEQIGDCCQLTELTLSSNDIQSLPSTIGRMTGLVTLKLDMNDLTILPASIGELRSLEELYLSSNKLESLPSSIGLLRKLLCLELDSNWLQSLPPEIGSCVSLRILTVQNNVLRSIPAEIGNLQNLTVLCLTKNRLQNLPMSVLKLRNLKALWLVCNQSKPLTPLVREYDLHASSMVLTCYLLPQPSSPANSDYDFPSNVEDTQQVHKQKDSDKPKIRFSLNPVTERQGILSRAPTPYPKKLRELAKSARAIISQASQPTSEKGSVKQNGHMSILNVSGNAMVDQVRTAVVKKQLPATSPRSSIQQGQSSREQTSPGPQQQPPPYHIAAAFSKQASRFNHREERRSDIDTEALCTLKDELLLSLPSNGCQRSQSEQSGSMEQVFEPRGLSRPESEPVYSIAMSDVDSAFVDNYRSVPGNHGTYSAYPGIVITDNSSQEPVPPDNLESSSYPISKVKSWLSSKTKSPLTTDNGCAFINMYPCENGDNVISDNNQNIEDSVRVLGKKTEELIVSSKITKPSKLPWLFGVHKNPKVVEVMIIKSGADLGFEVTVVNSGVYVKSVSEKLKASQMLLPGDKILQVEGTDIHAQSSVAPILSVLNTYMGPFSMMISRQN